MVDPCPSMKFVWNPLMLVKFFRVFLAGNVTTQSLFFLPGQKKFKLASPWEKIDICKYISLKKTLANY